ncbi:sensor histidine kinase [Isoptericola sp. NEAU-Y5]|uniref:histidine kinase n=1 Tax=Isoptericola luteus TaxID=2879484 RepID=A0ABS7ZCC1_9MICO|nr:sensor histidine kinase [Isoptericola sp. NEAU-Y5]MCA5892698.1 sensor histidine kinase [Isoptericola sp. NEAU-Y5]
MDAPTPDAGPLDRRRPRVFLGVALAVAVVVGTIGASHWQVGARPLDALGLALALAGPTLVVLNPRPPAVAVLAAVAAVGAYVGLGYAWGPALAGAVGVLVTVMLTGDARRARVVAWSGAALYWGVVWGFAALRDDGPRPAGLLAGAAWSAVALLVAGAARERAARAAAARAARDERERTAVATERLRIARELHDVLAHSLSAINVQAGVGLHLLDRDPGQARSALAAIKSTSRDALDEVRSVLGVVRGEDAADGAGPEREPRAPTWNLAALPHLAEPLRARGVDVSFDVDPALEPEGALPPHVAGIAYRVVQEALTNVGRHAPAARRVVVSVRHDDGTLHAVVSDDGGAADGDEPTPGYGLRGMRERVEGAAGRLDAGPGQGAAGDGFVVAAAVPAVAPHRRPAADGPELDRPAQDGGTP